MGKHIKTLVWLLAAILIISLICAFFSSDFNEHQTYFERVYRLFIFLAKIITVILVLYAPPIWLLRKWWKKKKNRPENKHRQDSQSAMAIRKFIFNSSAMSGALTIIYATLIAVFAHIISPDTSPHANDQVNEIAYKPPGFSMMMVKQPLLLRSDKINFFEWLISGKKNDYRLIPINKYWFSSDSLYIERYIGDGIQGQVIGFLLNDISINNNSAGRTEIEKNNITHRKYFLGTDDLGRDYLSRIILGIRISLAVGFVAVIIALLIGIPVGALAGFYKNAPFRIKISGFRMTVNLDNFIMWLINVIWAIPTLLLVFPIVFAFGQNYYTIFIAVGLTMWVDIARIVRGQVMQVRELEFIQAAKTFAYSDMRTIFRHVLPNIAGPVIVITAANFAYAILTEAGLSFLGIGVQPPAPSWGLMISKYKDNLITNPYLPLIPGFAITILVLAFFMVGNGLRDALDVKTKIEY